MQVHQRVAGRFGATLTLMGVMAASVLATPLALSADYKTMTKQMPLAPVRIIDAPRTVAEGDPANKDCAEQTWPYIEARCLTRVTASPNEIAPGAARSSTRPNDPQPPRRDAPNNSVGPTTTGTAHVAGTSSLPAPPGAVLSTLPGEMPASAPQVTEAARMAAVAGTVAAGLAITTPAAGEQPKVRTRSDRRRRTAHSSRSFRLFGFRVGGLRF
jgi:hypothetical protein